VAANEEATDRKLYGHHLDLQNISATDDNKYVQFVVATIPSSSLK